MSDTIAKLRDLLLSQSKAGRLRGLLDEIYGAAQAGAEAYGSASQPLNQKQAGMLGGLLADFTPVVGDVKSAYEGVQAAREGDYLGAGLGALGALPMVPNMAGSIKVIGPRHEAMETARKNAVKMLGLPESNTAMDRAKALGFDTDVYHGTIHDDIKSLKPVDMGAVFSDKTPDVANMYAGGSWTTPIAKDIVNLSGKTPSPNVLPLKYRGFPDPTYSNVIDKDPSNFRSRFAAFDPARARESDLLGFIDPKLFPVLFGGGVLGSYFSRADSEE